MEESASDINPFNLRKANSSNKNSNSNNNTTPIDNPEKTKVKFNPKDDYYDMSGEKFLVIFNQHTFKKTRYFGYGTPSTRNGTEKDEESLKKTFENLGFKVVVHKDKDSADIWKILTSMRNDDFSAVSCLCIAIMTHGFPNGDLCAADRTYNLRDVTRLFEGHPTLASKPKLFFIQACRGDQMDEGTSVAIDGDEEEKEVLVTSSHADFLIMRSTVEDYLSYRDCYGSWMIQALCKVLEEYSDRLDILQMITFVNKRVAYERATYTPKNKATNDKKQIPETSFTLTKLLRFR